MYIYAWIDSQIEKSRCCSTHLHSSSPQNHPTSPGWFFTLQNRNWRNAFPNIWLRCRFFSLNVFPALMGPLMRRVLVKETHYSGRPQVHTTYTCSFTANKVQIKRSLNLSQSSQYHVCKWLAKVIPPSPLSILSPPQFPQMVIQHVRGAKWYMKIHGGLPFLYRSNEGFVW